MTVNRIAPPFPVSDTGQPWPSPIVVNFEVVSTVIDVDLVPDYNRDGKITDIDRNQVTEQNPWRFWINNDDDDGDFSDSDFPGSNYFQDGSNMFVDGLSDMHDFFPLFLDLKKALVSMPTSKYYYTLSQADGALRAVYTTLNFGEGDLASGSYLRSLTVANQYTSSGTIGMPSQGGYVINEVFLSEIEHNNKGIILLEGYNETTQPLVLKIVRKSSHEIVLKKEFPLSISNVESMYRHYNVRSFLGGSGGKATDLSQPSNYPDSLSSAKHFVFLHGYNVGGELAQGWHSEMFKRFFWSGSKAKYVGVYWFGDPLTGMNSYVPDYHQAVKNAYPTSQKIKELIDQLGGDVTIAAHSLGNMVVSHALQFRGAVVSKYLAIDAAVALESYDGQEVFAGNMIGYGNHEDSSDNEWKKYDDRLYSTEWHKLFPASDGRSKLTWRDLFKDVGSSSYMYNFYSSTEDVLQEYEGNALVSSLNFGKHAWVKQEKFKGDWRSILGFVGTGSQYCGWGFNYTHTERWEWKVVGAKKGPMDPTDFVIDADFLESLKEKPLFHPKPSELFGDSGSSWATTHRFDLLSEAFPARTLPAGSNYLSILGPSRNFDMHSLYKTNASEWVRSSGEWRHSDFKEAPYVHTYKAFDEFVSKGGLR